MLASCRCISSLETPVISCLDTCCLHMIIGYWRPLKWRHNNHVENGSYFCFDDMNSNEMPAAMIMMKLRHNCSVVIIRVLAAIELDVYYYEI